MPTLARRRENRRREVAPGHPPRRMETFVCYGTLVYLASGTVEGALRFALASLHLETLLYLRDAFALTVVLWRLYRGLRTRDFGCPLPQLLALLVIWSAIGCRYTSGLSQVLFGFKIFLPLMLGIASYPCLINGRRNVGGIFFLLWSLATLGLFCSAVVRMPWVGLSYQVGETQVEGSREWTINGVDRLAGLSRSSMAVANQIVFFAIALACFVRSRLLRAGLWLASAPAIVLSTSRSSLMGYAAATGLLLAQSVAPSLHRIWKCAIPLLACIMVAAPLLPPQAFGFLESVGQGEGVGQTNSFFDRVENTWPDAFDLVRTKGSLILGRGVGGIGTPQKTFEPDLNNPADNLFVYLFALFGLASGAILGCILLRLPSLRMAGDRGALHAACVGLAVMAVGITSNCIEDSCISIFAGGFLSRLFNPRPDGN